MQFSTIHLQCCTLKDNGGAALSGKMGKSTEFERNDLDVLLWHPTGNLIDTPTLCILYNLRSVQKCLLMLIPYTLTVSTDCGFGTQPVFKCFSTMEMADIKGG